MRGAHLFMSGAGAALYVWWRCAAKYAEQYNTTCAITFHPIPSNSISFHCERKMLNESKDDSKFKLIANY